MNSLRHHLRLPTWAALLAMLALALLPTLSHALVHARGGNGQWVEVCTPQGMRWVSLAPSALDAGPAEPAEPARAQGTLEHCAFCAMATVPMAPPPARLELPAALAGPALMPPAFLHAPRTLNAWRSAQPRGPPFCS